MQPKQIALALAFLLSLGSPALAQEKILLDPPPPETEGLNKQPWKPLKEEDKVPVPTRKPPVNVTTIDGAGPGGDYLLSETVRIGADINRILELGVEGSLAVKEDIGGGLYLKIPVDDGWYGIARAGNSETLIGLPDNAAIGLGKRFRSGAMIEGRVGQMKRGSGGFCCSGEGTTLTINIVTAF